MSVNVSVESIADYLVHDRDVLEGPVTAVEPLGGGVSNTVFKVETETECLVVKQPYPNLDVEDDWPADVARVHNEARAARTYAEIVNSEGCENVRIPEILFEDQEAHIIGIECAPVSTTMWKTELLEGRIDPAVGHSVGHLLGTVHRVAANDEHLPETFADPLPFEQLRLDPYHRTVAERHPDLADAIEAEIDRVSRVKRTLVHGDYSPKNVLVDPETKTNWILDFEVAHWGDPAFDVAFMINHLLIKSLYNSEYGDQYVETIESFWSAYCEASEWSLEREMVSEVAVLLLARIDGKSPVEYIDSDRLAESIRSLGRTILCEDITTLEGVLNVGATERGL